MTCRTVLVVWSTFSAKPNEEQYWSNYWNQSKEKIPAGFINVMKSSGRSRKTWNYKWQSNQVNRDCAQSNYCRLLYSNDS